MFQAGRRVRVVVAAVVAALLAALALVVPTNPASAAPAKSTAPAKSPSGVMWKALGVRPAAAGHALQINAPHGRLFSLNTAAMKSALAGAPTEFTAAAKTAPAV